MEIKHVFNQIVFILSCLLLLSCEIREAAVRLPIVIDPEMSASDTLMCVDSIEYQLSKQYSTVLYNHENSIVYDFGRDAFGQLLIEVNGDYGDTLKLVLGECLLDQHVDPFPEAFRRAQTISIPLVEGKHSYKPAMERIAYADDIYALKMPNSIGEVLPFRYVEINKMPNHTDLQVSRVIVTCPFNDKASNFKSDNNFLNEVWDFCKYSIKATSFLGYYVDGDRERRPYEADALINQLGHYAVDSYYPIARRTCKYLLDNPTWPTEWIMQIILLAWNDYLFSGDINFLRDNYHILKARTLLDLVDSSNGLITTKRGQSSFFLTSIKMQNEMKDIVDWPHSDGHSGLIKGENDGYVYLDFNTVVNAYHYEVVKTMAKIADAVGCKSDAQYFSEYVSSFSKIFNNAFFDKERHVYVDGIGTNHASIHANMFPLAFDLVPENEIEKVADYVCSKGIACSVYGAQFLLEALYNTGRADVALNYMTNTTNRGWYNMISEGSTISMEAWGNEWKPDQDWNHAWGAAPANIIPFRLLGIRPIAKGFERVEVRPQLGGLQWAKGVVPTKHGDIIISVQPNEVSLNLPSNVIADVILEIPDYQCNVLVNGKIVPVYTEKKSLRLKESLRGNNEIKIKKSDKYCIQ